jgi:hypothetical protein
MTDRYASNAFYNYTQFEKGVFSGKGVTPAGPTEILKGDNPAFLWPGNNRRIAAGGYKYDANGNEIKATTNQPIQRGYMRMLAQGFKNSSALERRRLHFQFNPDSITRAVSARNDIQAWMNQDPVQMTQAIPGDANFSFELFFNREAEVVSGSYRDGANGPVVASTTPAQLPLTGAVSKTLDASAVTDIGVLADLIVFDEIIGQGVNSQLIDSILSNATKTTAQKRNAAASKRTNEPTEPATAVATVVDGKITKIDISETGAGYVVAPKITIADTTGTKAAATATYANGKITGLTVTNQGSGYSSTPQVIFTGGGSSSGSSTSDSQDQIPAAFDEGKARTSINTNFGNSAFLVSLPVRIVFSSLFMVEGFITSTNVTFNKFNPNMVPTQCVVGITMQALYIGFAREKTYLTQTLTNALNTSVVDETGSVSVDVQRDAAGVKTLGNDLFKKVGESDDGNNFYTNYDSKLNPKRYLSGDYTYSFSMKYFSSDTFKAELKKKTITSISQTATLVFEYRGNTGALQGSFPIGKKITFKNTEDMDISKLSSTGATNDGSNSITHQFSLLEDPPLYTGQSFDTSDTSKWTVSLTVIFNLKTSLGNEIEAEQKFIAKTAAPVKWDNDEISGRRLGKFVPATKGSKD